ncbi:MAG: RNA-binding transcriptional accessory protein [Candidatus Sabulitectum sp.]|nr:RNA-binding transcriptional accessory protein [Candidatus Sabulitectum sp.]
MNIQERITSELRLDSRRVTAVLDLMEQGSTIPFIARYRKEASGGMDEVVLTSLRDTWQRLEALEKRRSAVLSSLKERELLTGQLESSIRKAADLTELEDIYLPFRQKRRTRASKAIEKELEPLAELLLEQNDSDDPALLARSSVSVEKGVADVEEALQGARDIISERMSHDPGVRAEMRRLYLYRGRFVCKVIKGKEEEGKRFRDWFDWSEKVSGAPSHRVLAMRRGERELFLNLTVRVEEETAISIMKKHFHLRSNLCGEQVLLALKDGLKRLLGPQMETEVRLVSKEKADREATAVFALNLRELLMAAPLGGKRTMAIDPGFRTGCKTVCLDERGRFLEFATIFPVTGKADSAAAEVRKLIKKHCLEYIAVGNGTAGRETESFLRGLELEIPVVMVNESGASIYSASKIAREEFPKLDLTVRGAISIGRRLQDPLAELVKIDPGSVGVGQYQHDVDQKNLRQALDDTVMSCVNSVGVNLNTASAKLLSYVSGLSPARASSVVKYRDSEGEFTSRVQLKKVTGIGPVAFQQCAGFLRVDHALNPLDSSAVHPESYSVVEEMAAHAGTDVRGLMNSAELREQVRLNDYVTETRGIPTLRDIMAELDKPGRDPRSVFESFSFADVHSIDDLADGMKLPGLVTNVTDFGVFVDIGVHTDGLVHVSRLSTRWIRHPSEVVHAGMKVDVTVISIERARKRISLSMI